MSLFSRFTNVFRSERVLEELDEEMQSHIEEAVANGRDPEEARRAFGPTLQTRERSLDVRIAPRLDSLRADAIFGMRQLLKNKTTSAAAVLSLALAVGACTAAFRLIDAALLRPLPVDEPERLYYLTYGMVDREGRSDTGDSFEYPLFRELRTVAKGQADLMAISHPVRQDVTYGSDQDMEKAVRQFVSGNVFGIFGLRPALGRLLTESDDQTPGAHPYAVIAWHYWDSRFGRDPRIAGRTFKLGSDMYQIVGVAPKGFTGTEPGTLTDIFLPTMMNAKAIENANWSWFRTWLRLEPGASREQLSEKLRANVVQFRTEKAKLRGPRIATNLNTALNIEPAAAGVSGMQKNYRRSLYILAVMVGLVLLIACANVANLMTAQASARAREMALRVSIGAGRGRLVQLVLVESALIAAAATLLGGIFAWWSAPFVVSLISPPDNPVQFVLPADWRVLGFASALTIAVTLLFGMLPAFRASAVEPVSALKGGVGRQSRHRVMHALVAAQVAFCFLVHFVAGLFVATFDRLTTQPTGFATENVLVVEALARTQQTPELWEQVNDRVRSLPGVKSAAVSGWALMSGNAWSSDVWIDGRAGQGQNPYFLAVGQRWFDAMRVPLVAGREFRHDDRDPDVAIVNEAFARKYFDRRSPVGKNFERSVNKKLTRVQIVGLARDVRYANMRDAMRPIVFVPMRSSDWATFVVRTEGADPVALASVLRQEIPRARPDLRVLNINTQSELVMRHTVRERLLATLSLFFASVALLLAGVGLYGVLNYSVVQRSREIGIRMALGARPRHVARRITAQIAGVLVVGSAAGLAAGFASEQYIQTLLYQVKVHDTAMLLAPLLTLFTVSLLAAAPPVLRAVRIDPSVTLRAD